jgi:SSS family solute:Na+ symporter
MLHGKAEGRRLLRISRFAGIALTVVGIGTAISYARSESGMFRYVASVIATIMPPIAAVAILGALSKRFSPRGAVAGLVGGYVVSLVLLVFDLTGGLADIALDTSFFRCMVNFFVAAALLFVVSLFENYESDLIVSTQEHDEKTSGKTKFVAILLVAVIVCMYSLITWYFG